jgi:phage gp36-like protein
VGVISTASFVTQLWASLRDLDEMGPPIEALASKSAAEKARALRAAGGTLAPYVRSRYALPLSAALEELTQEGSAPGSVTVTGTPLEALSLAIRIDAPGGAATSGAVPITWSPDGGATFPAGNAELLPVNGKFLASGLVIAFSGTLPAGAIVRVCAGVDWGIRQHTVNVAAYNLVYNRGVPPESPAGAALRQRYEDAMAWAKDLGEEKGKLEERRDATPDRRETRARGGGQKSPWDFLGKL